MAKLQTWVALYDMHYPKMHWPTFNAVMEFLNANKVDGLILGGDQLDNEEISHHTRGKPIFRDRASYKRNTEGFNKRVLEPLERVVGNAKKVYVIGNHERFETDLIEEQPELEGVIERVEALKLEQRGWQVIPLGHAFKLGELNVIHGEVVSGVGNQVSGYPAKKALEIYGSNVLLGHTHSPQSFAKISPVEHKKKYMAWVSPILGETNPAYLRNRPTSWIQGLTIVELRDKGLFNLYPVICVDGIFSYGGKIYGSPKKSSH